MRRKYQVHPAIGIARLGKSLDEFFLGPEAAASTSVTLANLTAPAALQVAELVEHEEWVITGTAEPIRATRSQRR